MTKSVKDMEAELAKLRALVAKEEGKDDSNDDDVNDDEDEDDLDDTDDIDDKAGSKPKDEDKSKKDDDDNDDDSKGAVAKLKESLDNLDKKYKDALRLQKAAEKKAREAEIAALKKDGKELEALQKQIEDMEAELANTRDENVALKRDSVLDSTLTGFQFKSERSRKLARKDLIDAFVKGEDGSWISKDGEKSIEDYTAEYFEDDENRNLFLKTKTNSGTGTMVTDKSNQAPDSTQKSTSLFDMPQDQFMKSVRRKLGR